MASVQERLQLKRVPLENWTISEQLYLASAVACSGDQNWMSVSRSLKIACGHNRPSDWFSQKSCAAQYEMLLENVETPKRKKRNEKDTSQTTVETPIELILRKLTQERIAELNRTLQEEREEYAKLKDEVVGIQNNRYDESQLREMAAQIDAEEKQREQNKIKYNQWLKEREERKREMEKAWRTNANVLHSSTTSNVHSPTLNQHLTSQKVKIEEMDVDDPNSKQGTSPLLTSLLKSPSAAPNPSPSMLHNIQQNTQTRVAAPTITNLLTGSVTNLSSPLASVAQQTTSKPIVTPIPSITTSYPSQIQNQPLTGPAHSDQLINNITQSPSQAAPTLSMLLESKQKDPHKLNQMNRIESQSNSMHQMVQQNRNISTGSHIQPKTEPTDVDISSAADSAIQDEDQQLMEVFNEITGNVDMNELANIILDGLISEEQLTTVATVAESFVGQDNIELVPAQDNNDVVVDSSVKEEPININENACDAGDMMVPKVEDQTSQIEQIEENVCEKIEMELPKDEDSSDLSNDTPLSELIKQDATAKQQQQQQQQQQQLQQLQQQQQQEQQQQQQQKEEEEAEEEDGETNQQQQQQQEEHQEQKQNVEMKSQSPVTVSDLKKEEPIDVEENIEMEQEQNIDDDLAVLSEVQTIDEAPMKTEDQADTDVIKEEIGIENEGQNENENAQRIDDTEKIETIETEIVSDASNGGEASASKINIEMIPIDSSDSSDEKSLDNIKREIEALPELKDSNENSPAPPDEQTVSEEVIEEKDNFEHIPEPKTSRSSSRKEAAKKTEIKNEAKKSIKEEIIEKSLSDNDNEQKEDRKPMKTEEPESAVKSETTENSQNKSSESVIYQESANISSELENQKTATNDQTNTTEENVVEIIDDTLDDVVEVKNESSTSENVENKNESAAQAEIERSVKEEASDEKVSDVKSDDSRQDSVILIDSSDDVSADKNVISSTTKTEEPSAVSESAETKEKPTTSAKTERKASSDEEIFEDAKENLDEVTKSSAAPTVAAAPPPAPEPVEVEKPIPPPAITIDTDDDTPFMAKVGRVKKDYSRKKPEPVQHLVEKSEETAEDTANSGSISSRLRTKDRDRSESPFIEEDSGEPLAKYRRRYSTTPLIDSLPNSPASSDDREYRSWKKSILLVYNSLAAHRCASMFSKPITEEQAPNYRTIIYQPMDLLTLKRNIDSGVIRTTIEFKRYVMLMCYNAIFYNINDDLTCSRAKEMLNDALSLIQDFSETWKKENEKQTIAAPTTSTTKGRGRKSNRLAN